MEAFGENGPDARSGVLQRLSGVFQSGDVGSAMVLGESGIGKTALVRPLLRGLSGGLHAVQISGTAGLSAVAYGVFEQGIPGFPSGQSPHPGTAMRALRAGLAAAAGPVPALLVVDNAELLDEHSASLVSQLIASRTQRVLILGLPSPAMPREFTRLADEGQLLSLTLERLGPREAHAVCEQVLGGPVLRSAGAYYSVLSGGLPIMLLALLSLGRRQGTLMERRGTWIQVAPLREPDLRFVDLVNGRLSQLSASDMDVLNLVALGEPLGLAELLGLTEQPSVDKLTGMRLIRISDDFTVTSANPAYAGVLRGRAPVGRSGSLRARLGRARRNRAQSGQASARAVGWAMPMGEPCGAPQLLAAARTANRDFAPASAFQYASLVPDPGLAAAASVQMARADYHAGKRAAARARLRGVMETAADPEVLESAALLQASMCLQEGGTAGRLAAVARRWKRAAGRATGAESIAVPPGWQVLDWAVAASGGRWKDAEAGLRTMVASGTDGRPQHTPMVLAVAAALLSAIAGATGRVPASLHASAESLDLLGDVADVPAEIAGFVLLQRLEALVGAGHWGDVELEIEGLLERAPQTAIHLGGVIAWAEGQSQMGRGLHRHALAKLAGAVAALEVNDFYGLLPQATAAAAFAAALVGDSEAATRHAAAWSAMPPTLYRAAGALGQAHVLASHALLGDRDSHHRLQDLAATCQEAGLIGIALRVHMTSLASGGQPDPVRLGECARAGEWPHSDLLHAYVQALAERSATALLRVGMDASDADLTALARQAWLAARKAAVSRSATTLHKRINGALGTLEARDAPSPARTDIVETAAGQLTRRETSVARLAASRRSNSEIAALLSLSVRTVEGHMYRIFDKLGIRRREELVQLLFPRPD